MAALSRREFLRLAGSGLVGAAAVTVLPAAALASGEASGGSGEASGLSLYTPGTYTNKASGMNGDVTVTMTFDSSSITDVVVDAGGETPTIGGAAAEELVNQVFAAQGTEIDGVTGATVTSNAVREAAAKCISEAMGIAYSPAGADTVDPMEQIDADGNTVYYSMRRSWLGTPPEIREADISGELSADVVVIGANYSGASCFRMACEKGDTCIVIDSQAQSGFNSYGGQLGHFNSTWQEEVLGIPKSTFDPTDFIDSWQLQSGGRAQPDLLRKFAQRNGEIVDWLFEVYDDVKNVRSVVTPGPLDNYDYRKGYFMTYPVCAQLGTDNMRSSGAWCCAQVQKGLEASPGSQALYGMTAKVLIKDGDTVCGVIVRSEEDGKYYRIMSRKGVVLATGDFSANGDMFAALCTESQEANPYGKMAGNGRSGYGHRMGIWAGGVMELGPRSSMGGATSSSPGGFFGACGGLWLNKYGKRYCNEAFGAPFVAGVQTARQAIGSSTVHVWDNTHWREMATNQPYGHFNMSNTTDANMDALAEKLAQAYAAGPDGANGVYAADDLETLAGYLGYEGEAVQNFVNSVKTYDSYAAAGKDPDYAKAPNMLFRICDAPFYAQKSVRMAAGALVTLAGLFVDGDGKVLDQHFDPIPGLYAVGNASGGRFPLQYTSPMNGISIGMATVLGALTGEYIGLEGPVVSSGDSATSARGTV